MRSVVSEIINVLTRKFMSFSPFNRDKCAKASLKTFGRPPMSNEVNPINRRLNRSTAAVVNRKHPLIPSVCNEVYGVICAFSFETSVTSGSMNRFGQQKAATAKSSIFLHPY